MKLLKMKDVMRLRSISQEVLFEHTLAQLQRQHYYLSNLRIRNTSMVNAFGDIISSAVNKKSDINTWVVNSKHLLSKEFDKIAVEGSRWKGQGITMTNLILPMNEICHHSLYAILCLDLVTIDALDRGLTTSSVSLHEFIERVSENVMSFAKEKFGVSPEIFVKGDANVEIFPPLIEYVTVEIAKNSIKAVVDRYGALDIDDAPPIEVNINQHLDKNSESGIISIMFKDCGVGMNEHALRRSAYLLIHARET